ncbi:MAG: DUF2309 domain-containing protein [Chromatiales bacterium]|nr:DUF2309 domain-containing protein [Chromatiales bacterium]
MNEQNASPDVREALRQAIEHFEHVLPAQAPIRDFVHHNTLHGFQHLKFPDALKAAREVNGSYGYQSGDDYRRYYREGRISRDDLTAVLADDGRFASDSPCIEVDGLTLTRIDITIAAMSQAINPVTNCQLTWLVEEQGVLSRFYTDIEYESRRRILEKSRCAEPEAINRLWEATLERLGLHHFLLHPEELTDLSPELNEQLFGDEGEVEGHQVAGDLPLRHTLMRRAGGKLLDELLEQVGNPLTLRALLQQLTGHDILQEFRPALIRLMGAYLDQGLASWHGEERQRGFLAFWRGSAKDELGWLFDDLPEWHDELELLADEALDVVVDELQRLGLPEARWAHYIERLALELPGWSGMFLWRHNNPGYEGVTPDRVEMMEYLAVRLVLERIYAQRLCRRLWRIEASLEMLRWYFRRRRSELYVRYTLFNQHLPEYLVNAAQRLCESYTGSDEYEAWQQLADRIWIWKRSPASDTLSGHTVLRSGWRLFLLAQHLGLCADEVSWLRDEQLEVCFAALDMDDESSGFLWLQAYERHYHEQVYNALTQNHGRGPWAARGGEAGHPSAQLIFCMDDREESIRRHLEELDPSIETLGAAAHFNIFQYWKPLDSEKPITLCPVVAVPTHETREVPAQGQEALSELHLRRRRQRLNWRQKLLQSTRLNPVISLPLMALAAPVSLFLLAGKLFAPYRTGTLLDGLRRRFDKERVVTDVIFSAEQQRSDATPSDPQSGFSDGEQADRCEAFLKNNGMLQAFSRLVVITGHGSMSQNNPHLAAYDCGACSGRHSGANARIFAAFANRPAVRALLRDRGITIEEDVWFIGAEHNTCDEQIHWYDLDKVPASHQGDLERLQATLAQAVRHSAHERARRFASAPDTEKLGLERAYRHSIGRSMDFSQARPELGHATNGFAFIGRRAATRGAFFDRRAFLISYDPTTDIDGKVIERLLLANGPVGAGINLEYYFSTVNNEGYGCGSKVTHNVNGLFGVMHGASDDLRTGLPRQMIEIHEAMRLLVVVEAKCELLTEIYMRQPALQELIGNGWLIVAAKNPDTSRIDRFIPDRGWVEWQGELNELPVVRRSADWYTGHRQPLPMSLIAQQGVECAS